MANHPGVSVELSRRRFLALSGAAVGVAAVGGTRLAASAAASASGDAARRVVVVGAGLAGLTTALDLVDAGWDVTVFEARGRVGGRVKTNYFEPGLHAELGGESIDDNHHAMLAMLKRFGLSTERRAPLKPYDAHVYRDGVREPLAVFVAQRGGRVATDYFGFYDQLSAASAGVDPMYPERAKNAAALDARTLESFIAGAGLAPEAEFLVRTAFRGEYNAEPRDLSLLFIAQQTNGEDPGLTGAETMRIAGGNSQLPQRMAAALGDKVQLSRPVTRIAHGPGGVVVTAGGASVPAAYAVLAAPVPPLRNVAFDPPLPPAAAAMIAGLDLGTAAKVVTEYAVPFWQAEGFSGFTLTDLPFHIGWSPTDSYVPPQATGLLSQFITGDAAVTAANLTDAARISTFIAQLAQVYPESVPLRTGRTATMAWANEPYTRGGYAIFRPGQMAAFWPVLRNGVGRILFAGEHTEVLIGYMESAIRSGHRIAAQIGQPPAAGALGAASPPASVQGEHLRRPSSAGSTLPATGSTSLLLPAVGALGAGLLVRRAAAAAAAQSAGADRSTSSTGTAPRTSRWSS